MSMESGSEHYKLFQNYTLRSGEALPELKLVYETLGKLNEDKSNMILIQHALSPSHRVSKWWEKMVGPGCAIDTNQFYVMCINNLGSCYGSTGPQDETFPVITMQDIVDTHVKLLDELALTMPITVIGNSMGAMLSLQMAIDYPERVKQFVSTSSAYRAYASNVINRSIQKRILKFDLERWPSVNDGSELMGFNLARELGYFTYRHPSNLIEKFPNHVKKRNEISEVESYFDYNAKKFTKRFSPFSYLYLLDAMDLFDVTCGYEDDLAPFKKITARALVISVDSDILFTPIQQKELYEKLKSAGVDTAFIMHHSDFGHDAFLVDIPDFGNYLRDFIS